MDTPVPIPIEGDKGLKVITEGLTVTVTLLVPVQLLDVPVTVYVVVTAGVAVTVAAVVGLKPVVGDHEYVVVPSEELLAVKETLPPELQILGADGETETTGAGFTVTSTGVA